MNIIKESVEEQDDTTVIIKAKPIFDEEIQQLKQEQQGLEESFSLINSQMNEIRSENQNNLNLKEETEAKSKQIKEMYAEINKFKGSEANLKVITDNKMAEIEELNKIISEIEPKINTLSAELADQKVTKQEYDQMNEEENILKSEKSILERDLSEILASRRENQAKINEIEPQIMNLLNDINPRSALLNSVSD